MLTLESGALALDKAVALQPSLRRNDCICFLRVVAERVRLVGPGPLFDSELFLLVALLLDDGSGRRHLSHVEAGQVVLVGRRHCVAIGHDRVSNRHSL